MVTTVNMAGGQPISMENSKALRALAFKHIIKIVHDMTRVAENVFMIQQNEEGYKNKSVATIVWEICRMTDIASMSAKKDALVNIGGFLAVDITESVADANIRARVGQVQYLGKKLLDLGISIVKPIGTHGVFLDAKRNLSHIPQDQFPAQALAAELYIDSGVRAMERGIVSAGRNKKAGEHNYPGTGTHVAHYPKAGLYPSAHGRSGGFGGIRF